MDQPETAFSPNILVAPLDWGLGHATRCIPLIHELLFQNVRVIIAASGAVENLLHQEFPSLPFVELKGYGISYSKNKWTLPFVVASQIPKIISAIQYENERLKAIVKEHNIDGIISDNRYGLSHSKLPSVFITHQLMIKTALGKIADDYLQSFNYKYINRFSECWVPDIEQEPNFAGILSHPVKMPAIPVKYIGSLSRLKASQRAGEKHLLVILSGPEPQRAILEALLFEQVKELDVPAVFVRGLPGSKERLYVSGNTIVHNHLSAKELNALMNEANYIIGRCGYSTVMDLACVKKKSILIPTPGQTEQEYLAKHLLQNNFALTMEQNKFNLKAALNLAESFPYELDRFKMESHLQTVVRSFVLRCGR